MDLSGEALAARAATVLRGNDLGRMTKAAPLLYPHMWSWDAAFIAVGLATLSVDRAITEIDTLLAAQWRNGMIPHIVFSPSVDSYFPGAARWKSSRLAEAAPAAPETSGICQPPVHALAVQRILEAADRGDAAERRAASDFFDRTWPKLLAWHRWLAEARDPDGVGRVTIHHGWESGMDNSPRWDGPYSRVEIGADLPSFTRKDQQFVGDAGERPSDEEYARYLWLVEQMRRARYDDRLVRATAGFVVEDVLFSALLAVACDELADLGEERHKPVPEVEELRELSARFRQGVAASLDPMTGTARDRDVRAGAWLISETVAGFAPLLCGGVDADVEQTLLALLDSERWCGHSRLSAAVPPSTSPASPDFRNREYWRGPQWPIVAWLFTWAFARNGWVDRSQAMKQQGLGLLAGGEFGEYYEPFTGDPLGSRDQSWTAAVALDWLSPSLHRWSGPR